MPWDERTRMDQRLHFIAAMDSCEFTMSELCREYGISRKTGYKWVRRYADEGLEGLRDRSRRPKWCPHRTDQECAEALVALRQSHPTWGPRKLLAVLSRREPDRRWPAASTAGDLLKRRGLVQARRRRRGQPVKPRPVVSMERPNQTWTGDFKGEFRLGDRSLCYPLTIRDGASRAMLACSGKRSPATASTREVFEETFRRYGLPEAILTDGGVPFAHPTAIRRLSRLSVWWIRLGVTPVVTQPGRPDQNGAHEQMHRVLKAETARPPAGTLANQQRRFDAFVAEYNSLRPHEALGMRTPNDLYEASSRPYPSRLLEPVYPRHFEVRRVRSSGEFKLSNRTVFLSEVLHRELIGLEEIDDRRWSIHFGPVLLARYNEREHHLQRL